MVVRFFLASPARRLIRRKDIGAYYRDATALDQRIDDRRDVPPMVRRFVAETEADAEDGVFGHDLAGLWRSDSGPRVDWTFVKDGAHLRLRTAHAAWTARRIERRAQRLGLFALDLDRVSWVNAARLHPSARPVRLTVRETDPRDPFRLRASGTAHFLEPGDVGLLSRGELFVPGAAYALSDGGRFIAARCDVEAFVLEYRTDEGDGVRRGRTRSLRVMREALEAFAAGDALVEATAAFQGT